MDGKAYDINMRFQKYEVVNQRYLLKKKKSLDFQGNVALDVARILLRPATELATTDIASHALAALEESSIRSFLSCHYVAR